MENERVLFEPSVTVPDSVIEKRCTTPVTVTLTGRDILAPAARLEIATGNVGAGGVKVTVPVPDSVIEKRCTTPVTVTLTGRVILAPAARLEIATGKVGAGGVKVTVPVP